MKGKEINISYKIMVKDEGLYEAILQSLGADSDQEAIGVFKWLLLNNKVNEFEELSMENVKVTIYDREFEDEEDDNDEAEETELN